MHLIAKEGCSLQPGDKLSKVGARLEEEEEEKEGFLIMIM